jgi:hypothetical protein
MTKIEDMAYLSMEQGYARTIYNQIAKFNGRFYQLATEDDVVDLKILLNNNKILFSDKEFTAMISYLPLKKFADDIIAFKNGMFNKKTMTFTKF